MGMDTAGAGARRWLLLLVPVLLLVVLAHLTMSDFAVGFFNDDVVYIALSRSLLAGHGLHDICLAGAPADTQFPPGYPLLLALVSLLAPGSLHAAQWLSVGATVCALGLLYAWARSLLSPWALFMALCLTALNTVTVRFCTTVLSDPIFVPLVLCIPAVYLTAPSRRLSARRAALLGLVCVAAFWVRSAALFFVPGLAVVLLMETSRGRAQPRSAPYFLAVTAVGCLPYVLLRHQGAYSQFLLARYKTAGWYGVLWDNLRYYALNLPAALVGEPSVVATWFGQHPLVWACAFGLLIAGAVRGWRRLEKSAALLVAGLIISYTAFLLCWPFQDMRFFMPIFPLLYVLLAAALEPRSLVLGLLLVSQVWFATAIVSDATGGSYRNRLPFRAYAWVRQHTPPTSVIATARSAAYLYANRVVAPMPYLAADPRIAMLGILKSPADLVIISTPTYPFDGGDFFHFEPALRFTLEKFPAVFRVAYRDPRERTIVFTVQRGAARALLSRALTVSMRQTLVSQRKALAMVPALFPARCEQALLLLRRSRYRRALDDADRTLTRASFYLPAWLVRVNALANMHRPHAARQSLRVARKVSRQVYHAWLPPVLHRHPRGDRRAAVTKPSHP